MVGLQISKFTELQYFNMLFNPILKPPSSRVHSCTLFRFIVIVLDTFQPTGGQTNNINRSCYWYTATTLLFKCRYCDQYRTRYFRTVLHFISTFQLSLSFVPFVPHF